MNEIYILGGLRSYIGVENGIYKNILPEDLGAEVLKSLIEKYNIKKVRSIASYFFNIICKFNTKKIYFSKQIYYNNKKEKNTRG